MKIEVDANGNIVLKEVYSGVLLETAEGNTIGVCMRDDTLEIDVYPKGATRHSWHRVDMQKGTIVTMNQAIPGADMRTSGGV